MAQNVQYSWAHWLIEKDGTQQSLAHNQSDAKSLIHKPSDNLIQVYKPSDIQWSVCDSKAFSLIMTQYHLDYGSRETQVQNPKHHLVVWAEKGGSKSQQTYGHCDLPE